MLHVCRGEVLVEIVPIWSISNQCTVAILVAVAAAYVGTLTRNFLE